MISISSSSFDLKENGSLWARFFRLMLSVTWLQMISLFPWAVGTAILAWQGLTQEVAVMTFSRSLFQSIFGFELSITSLIQLRCGSFLARGDDRGLRSELWKILASLLGIFVLAVGVVLGSSWGLRAIGVEPGFVEEVFAFLLKICVFAGLNLFASIGTGLIVTAELSAGLGTLSIFMLAIYSVTLAIFMVFWPLALNGFIIALSVSTAMQALIAAALFLSRRPRPAAPPSEESQPINAAPDPPATQPESPGLFATVKVTLFLGLATAFETIAVEMNYLVLASTNNVRDIYVYGIYMLEVCFIFFVYDGFCTASRAVLLDFLDRGEIKQFVRRSRDFLLAGLGLVAGLGLLILATAKPFARAFGPDSATESLIILSLLYGFWFNLVDYASAYTNTILPIVGLEKELFCLHTFAFLPLTLISSIVFVVMWKMGIVGAILSFIFADIITIIICGVILKRRVPSFLKEVKENKRPSPRLHSSV